MMICFFTFLVKIVRWVITVSSVGTNYATEVDKKCQRDSEGPVNTGLHLEMNSLLGLFPTGLVLPEEASQC